MCSERIFSSTDVIEMCVICTCDDHEGLEGTCCESKFVTTDVLSLSVSFGVRLLLNYFAQIHEYTSTRMYNHTNPQIQRSSPFRFRSVLDLGSIILDVDIVIKWRGSAKLHHTLPCRLFSKSMSLQMDMC